MFVVVHRFRRTYFLCFFLQNILKYKKKPKNTSLRRRSTSAAGCDSIKTVFFTVKSLAIEGKACFILLYYILPDFPVHYAAGRGYPVTMAATVKRGEGGGRGRLRRETTTHTTTRGHNEKYYVFPRFTFHRYFTDNPDRLFPYRSGAPVEILNAR